LKFYIEYRDEGDIDLDQELQHIAHKFKYRIMWELRDLETRIEADAGNFKYTTECRIQYFGNDPDLAQEISVRLALINFEKW
jgi:hypothetical protein